MILVSIIFYGYIVDDVAFIAGFVMAEQEGVALNRNICNFIHCSTRV